MKRLIKRTVKAATPYGALVIYRRLKPRYSMLRIERKNRKNRSKNFNQMITMAQIINGHRSKVVLSVTSYGDRLQDVAPLAIASLFCQTRMPDKIILWLAFGEKPPREITKMKKLGLEVRYCSDIKSYKKLIPTLKMYPDSTIITADDDVQYPNDWLEILLKEHRRNPHKIIAHTAKEVLVGQDGQITPYWNWPEIDPKKKQTRSTHIMPNGIGGVLYPARSLNKQVLDDETFMALAPSGDDLWFWAMAELHDTKRVVVNGGYQNIRSFELDSTGLWNTENAGHKNDEQFNAILQEFAILKKRLGVITKDKGVSGLRFDPKRTDSIEDRILFAKHQFAYCYAEQQAKKDKAQKILDYGCGDGYGADFLAKKLPMAKVFATDIDSNALEEARKKYNRKNLYFTEMGQLEKYDLIVSYQVIEHVENVNEYLGLLGSMLNDNGKIIISTPDRRYRLTDKQAPWNPYHLREYSKESLKEDVQKVFPGSKVLQLSGEANMLKVEYRRVAGMRDDRRIYKGEDPDEASLRKYSPEDFYLTTKDTQDSLDLFAVITNEFPGSAQYWESRYLLGGNSGAGSYNNLAKFKADIINDFVKKHRIHSIIELGMGDGNQLSLADYPSYVGFDVSITAVNKCKEMFKDDSTKRFYTLDRLKSQQADITLSLDVLFHLIEPKVFAEHLQTLFRVAKKFVIIYAVDDDSFQTATHVRSRRFTKYIEDKFIGWELKTVITNKYPHNDADPDHTSRANFYIYKRIGGGKGNVTKDRN